MASELAVGRNLMLAELCGEPILDAMKILKGCKAILKKKRLENLVDRRLVIRCRATSARAC